MTINEQIKQLAVSCGFKLTNETEAETIAAANQDYRRRVLQCLVNGGV